MPALSLMAQVEMVNPMRNKKCQHYYDQEAALSMIKSKQKNGKKFRFVCVLTQNVSTLCH